MGEVINLRRARKRREKAGRERTAQAKRVEHGRAKAEHALTQRQSELERARLEAHLLEPPAPKDES
jgi:hypothetical protein